MATTLISSDPSLQVRKARNGHDCYGGGKWWRSHLCTGKIRKGSTYVAKCQRGIVAGSWRWMKDLRHYCPHCALVALPAVKVGEDQVAA